ncbi:putative 3-demethylubiquinone-9 3-methyltransferase (glyoxalase superfamily) [Kineococcus xinjiangensis]|uniref:Putative 3-demethylubiquinone-9 3-methyltransferase (Glyoxalase superfamily) n=1 Tax=Kineococcus xinjiangensis TaxID=512762 RepID=A0A2S6IW45_9ACTN|nr:VOC family protein [Kineococcus xinjiangensis]PPK98460.1 putative 3-demethylubiquinone-9 3-methyltransferase (glyoxalase superfamily) [Kineococcus xinjiangensis]
MPTTIPCLWFDDQAEQAAEHYTSIFPNSEVLGVTRYGPGMPGREDSVMTVDVSLDGQRYVALNGGPQFTFSEAVSFQIMCADQAEVDHYWDALTDGGEEAQCGWLKDRFGVSWQVVPTELPDLLASARGEAGQRLVQALFGMRRIDIAELRRAVEGVPA